MMCKNEYKTKINTKIKNQMFQTLKHTITRAW